MQHFFRLLKKPALDFTLLNKAFGALRSETWEMVNHVLALGALAEETITVDHVRTDTTVTECNIHWPTDSSLLWDVYRVAAREMATGRELDPICCPWRFHSKKIKKLHLFVTRYSNSEQKASPQGSPGDEDADRPGRGSSGKSRTIRRLGRTFDVC